MRILVTGAGGFIGRWLVPTLLKSGHDVVCVDRRPRPRAFEALNYVRTNLLKPPEAYIVLEHERPDAVVHLAALYGRLQGERRVDWTVRLNTELTTVLAKWCGEHSTRFVYTSSSEVYGRSDVQHGQKFLPGRPWWDTCPLNVYGWTKLWGEQVAEHYAPNGLVIVRLNMPYGPDDPKGVAETGRNALHTFLWRANTRQPITVHRGVRRSYTWVGDVVDGMRRAIEREEPGRYVICRNDDQRTAREVAELACEVTGAPTSLISEIDVPAGITIDKSLDVTSTYALGWKPIVNLEEGTRWTFEWIKHFDERGIWTYDATCD